MNTPQYADVSAFQGAISWPAYKQWAASFDGIARVAMKATEGVGFTDARFITNRAGALAAGIDQILYYGYARPDLGNSPVDEANYLHSVVGAIREQDLIMLDVEVTPPVGWAYKWLAQQEANYGGKLPVLYSYDAFVRAHLQDARLTRYPLIVAHYTYDANARPPCPPPWTSYLAIQFSDRATIPGIAGACDANVWLGGNTPVVKLSSTGEIADFLDVDQFQPAKSQYECGYFSGAIIKAMAPVGSSPTQSVPQMIAEAEAWYAADHGNNAISNTAGMSLQQEYDLITQRLGLHYQAVALDAATVRGWVRAGYPIMLTISETSVVDMALGRNPYPWTPSGTHIIVVTGVASDGNLLVRDPANCTNLYDPNSLRPGPRKYDAGKLQIWTATVVVPTWLPRPTSPIPPQGGNTMPVPTGWTDDGHTLMAPNKVPVMLGFRQHILQAASWDAGNVPQESEYHTDQVLLHNASVGAGQRQCFRDSLLWYTPAKGVIEEPFLGLEIDAAYKLIDSLKAQLAQAQQPTPAPVDTSAVEADINAIADAIAVPVAKALADLKKL